MIALSTIVAWLFLPPSYEQRVARTCKNTAKYMTRRFGRGWKTE